MGNRGKPGDHNAVGNFCSRRFLKNKLLYTFSSDVLTDNVHANCAKCGKVIQNKIEGNTFRRKPFLSSIKNLYLFVA